ncbi:MAG: nucleotidyltransferase family protein [Halobacteriales archaeon]|nr:nucleotidyltransferase family protein [Halobacteriales archaeon]
MTATAGTTTIELPLPLRARLARLRTHPRQPYHEVIRQALDVLEARQTGGLDPLVAKHRVELRLAARKNGIARIWLFGSRARNEARPDSDVDILYQTKPGVGMWEASAFVVDAEDILGTKVDIADIDGLSPRMRESVLPEAKPI